LTLLERLLELKRRLLNKSLGGAMSTHQNQTMKRDLLTHRTKDYYLILLLIALLVSGCRSSNDTPLNLQQSSVSPSGRYTLTVLIEENQGNPTYNETKVWKVTISNAADQVIYKDDGSEFVGNLMVYWLWDAEDRVWLYNSDTGEVYFWELMDSEWIKIRWGAGKEKEIDREIMPPAGLYPPYVQ
jgi:uncharacterized protein YcfL